MRLLLFLIFISFANLASAKNFYVSNSGNDNNDGLTTSSPWKTVAKVSSFTSLAAGDQVLFNRGEIFYGKLIINNSGSSGNPITIGAYGTGANPIITGFTTVSSWTNLGGNIWESTSAVSSLSSCNIVVINGANTPMGRYPNTGWLTYQSFSGNTSITSSSLTGSPNWTGAEVVIRKKRYIIDRSPITSQSGSTLTYNSATPYNGQTNYGFFIQNDTRTLDQQNEWYYNSSTGKIRVFSSSAPTNVQVSSIDNLVSGAYKNNISFNNISFTGGNSNGFYLGSCANITIQNCSIDFCNNGFMGVDQGVSSANFVLNNSTINHSNNIAINLSNEFHDATITNNIIKNSGLIAGMAKIGDVSYQAIYTSGLNTNISFNEIDSSGYIGISFNGNVAVKNNYVHNYCLLKDDGAGIYTTSEISGSVISNNIVLNGIGNGAGTPDPTVVQAEGIYLDSYASGIEVSNNTVSNVPRDGIYLHNAKNVVLKNNTVFNSGYIALEIQDDVSSFYISGLTNTGNIFFAKDASQKTARYYSLHNDISSFGTTDNNYYARPIDDNSTINVIPSGDGNGEYNYSLSQWQGFSGLDANSKKSPKAITNVSDLRLEYNATSSSKTISLDANYIDVKNISYNGTITLAPYTSAVLIKNGASTGNQSPVANAGNDGTITLPINSVSLAGTGTDADGSISAYNWTQTSGPSSGTITSPNTAATTITGMVQGVYVFQLQVTDNIGATGLDNVQITVNANSSGNISPVANAGANGTITTNTVSLSGSGTDADGTITAYSWSQTSGPAPGIFSSPNSGSTTVTGLVQGVYQFQLIVTDNNGATGVATVQINVNSTGNISPVANAGGNGTITLPTNIVILTGTGTDADGTIAAYNWSQISGPAPGIFSSPNSAATTVTGLVQGVYQFQLKVTDNNGATGVNNVQINVNSVPIANAGNDGTITLPTNTVSLTGTGTDAGGIITAYSWSQISGPAPGIFSNSNTAATTVTGLVQGVYQFQLQVTDNYGATGISTVQINVVNSVLGISSIDQTITSLPEIGIKAYPNPFANYIEINITGGVSGTYKLMLVDALGRIVWTKSGIKNTGDFQQSVNTSTLERGIYFLKVNQNNTTSVLKLVK